MDKIIVRRATLEDVSTVVSFNLELARESEGKELDQQTLQRGCGRVLADESKGRYYLLEASVHGGLYHGGAATAG